MKGAVVPTVTVDALMVGNKGWVAKNPHEVKQIAALKLNWNGGARHSNRAQHYFTQAKSRKIMADSSVSQK